MAPFCEYSVGHTLPPLFSLFDDLLVLQVPSFEVVYQWRLLQEQKLLANTVARGVQSPPIKTLNAQQVKRFTEHFQRLSQHGLNTLNQQARWVLRQNAAHQITAIKENN